MIRVNDMMWNSGETDTVTGNDSFKVPFCDGFDVPSHGPGGEVNGSGSTDESPWDSYSLSFPPRHTICLCAYDRGFKALVRMGKVALLDFEYYFGRE